MYLFILYVIQNYRKNIKTLYNKMFYKCIRVTLQINNPNTVFNC